MKQIRVSLQRRCMPPVLGLLLLAMWVQGHPGTRAEAGPVARYIAVLRDRVPRDAVPALSRRIVETHGLAISRRAAPGETGDPIVFRHAVKGFAVRLTAGDERKIEALRRHPDVAYVARSRPLRLHAQLFQPGMERIRADRNFLTAVNDVDDVRLDADIAVLDTGIDSTHPDLNVHRSVSFVTGDATLVDPHGHGTHVAGIAAAIDDAAGVHGVAPGARLWSVKVADADGVADDSDVLSGLDYVMAHADEIDVVNMSLGGPGFADDGNCGATVGDPLHQAICNVVDAGVVVVASAGNHSPYGLDASLVTPASYDEVITVSAVIETDGHGPGWGTGPGTLYGVDNSFARTFSNYGWDVDIAAPGVEIVSTWPGGEYSTQTGTSMSAAFVSGAAAVWIAKYGKPVDGNGVRHLRNELVRLGFPQFGSDFGFSGDKESFSEPLLDVGAIDPLFQDPVEPDTTPDRTVYEYGLDREAIITLRLRDARGLLLEGIPSNGFQAYLAGDEVAAQYRDQGAGSYTLTVNIASLPPGDHDFMAVIRTPDGFERSSGCRIVIQAPEPRILIHDLRFAWPVMSTDGFFGSNPLHAAVIDEEGAPLVLPLDALYATFSGDGSELVWSVPPPDFSTGVNAGITHGAYRTEVDGIQSLALGTYYADLTVSHEGLADSAIASFDVADHDPSLAAELRSNLSSYDLTQTVAPPALNLRVDVRSEWSTGVSGLLYLLPDPLVLRIDGVERPGVTFVEELLDRGVYRARDVDIGDLPHGPHDFVVHVTDTRGLQAESNLVTIDVVREIHPCSNPLAGEGETDTDGDGLRDECDNCPTVSNRSQRNTYWRDDSDAALGDACKSRATVRTSSDIDDNPDFLTIQEAVDGATAAAEGVRIEILPGVGPYVEHVTIDRGQSFHFDGRNLGSGLPVIEHDGVGSSIFDIRSTGDDPVSVRNLVLRGQGIAAGQRGISTAPGLRSALSDLRFGHLEYGLHLQGGEHLVERIEMDATVGTGVHADDASVMLTYGEFRGVARAIRVVGSSADVDVEHVLVVGNGIDDGITSDASPSGSLDLKHSTIVQCAAALSGNGGNTTVAHSILWNNQLGIRDVPCSGVTWSDIQGVDCGGANRSIDPRFEDPFSGDYRLHATSPLLEHGPDPIDYTGMPCTDLDGEPRLRDHDRDNLARIDPGAFERENIEAPPREVTGLVWTGPTTLQWESHGAAAEYHVYRARLGTLGYSSYGTCENGLDAVRADTFLTDTEVPATGGGFYYAITTEDGPGDEFTLGIGSCAERSNFNPCP